VTRGNTACPQCQNGFTAREAAGAAGIACPVCGIALEFTLFPALFRDVEPARTGQSVGAEDQASCFFHENREAVVACDQCGRFLCELCDLEMSDRHLCPQCLQAPASDPARGNEITATKTIVLYDSIALSLAVAPLLVPYVTIFTAPIVLFLVVRYWRRQQSAIPRSRVRFVVAAGFAVLELVGWAVLVGVLAVTFLR